MLRDLVVVEKPSLPASNAGKTIASVSGRAADRHQSVNSEASVISCRSSRNFLSVCSRGRGRLTS